MELVAIMILLALAQYIWFGILVGRARGRCQIAAPAVTGHPEFERYFRVQQNTIELLVVLVPALWLFALYVNPRIGAALAAVYLVGRFVYLRSYVTDPTTRSAGFGLSMLPILALLVGALWGAGLKLI
jgi:uncharacterized MAPEG superfamily protein